MARRVERELASRPPGGPIACLALERPGDPGTITSAVITAARALLAHDRMVDARDAPGEDGPTELAVLLVASMGERAVRDVLAGAIAALEDRLQGELGPLFASFRTGAARNLVIAPLLAMPHPQGREGGAEIADAVRDLVIASSARPASARATPKIWVIEDVLAFSILSEEELAQNLRNFLTLLLHARPALDGLRELLRSDGAGAGAPLATFACAIAELPRERLARWATDHVALELLDDVLDAPLESAHLSEVDALEEVELTALDPRTDAAHVVRDLIERYLPPIEPDAAPAWHESAEAIRDRYGPDHGDPGEGEPQAPPARPVGFALDRMERIEEAWRLLQRRRFDDLVARERAELETAREALLARVCARVDRELWSPPAPDGFRRTRELTDKLRRGTALKLEDAIAERDAIVPSAAPRFDDLRTRHAELLDAARAKPDLRAMALWGGLAIAGAVLLVPSILVAIAMILDVRPDEWYEPWLRARAHWTAAIAATLAILGVFALRIARAHRDVLGAHRAMWDAIRATVLGSGASVESYFTSRLRLARMTARVQALLALRAALDRDAATLEVSERAGQRARAELKQEQESLAGTREREREPRRQHDRSSSADTPQPRDREDPAHQLARVLASSGETLVEGMTDRSAARSLLRQLPSDARTARVVDLLRELTGRERWPERWREEPPFSSIASLRAVAGPRAEGVARWDPFAASEDAERTAEQIAAFVRRQARSLRVPLDFAGRELEATDADVVYRGVAIVPPGAVERVSRLLDGEPAAGASIDCVRGVEADRAYWLIAVTAIALDRVASLRRTVPTGAPRAPQGAAAPPRFEIEQPEKEGDR